MLTKVPGLQLVVAASSDEENIQAAKNIAKIY
jgi:hypothetical protein